MSTEQTVNFAFDVAQKGKADPTGETVDVAIAAISVGYPPAGIALGFVKGLITSGSSGPDPVGQQLVAINQRIDELQNRLAVLDGKLNAVQDRQFNDENRARERQLADRNGEVVFNTAQLTSKPTPHELPPLLAKAQFTADQFINDPDLWQWSDLHVSTDKVGNVTKHGLDPDFKTFPAFESYAQALMIWMSALEYASEGNPSYITSNRVLVRNLLRHAAFLSVEPTFQELEPTEVRTLPEQVLRTTRCSIGSMDKYPDPKTGICHVDYSCVDYQRHTRLAGGSMAFQNYSARESCQFSVRQSRSTPSGQQVADLRDRPKFGSEAMTIWQQWDPARQTAPAELVGKEQELQCQNGLEVMTILADKLYRLAKTGSSRDAQQYIGQFDMTFYSKELLYGVKADGSLLWYQDLVGIDKNPPKQDSSGVIESAITTPCGTLRTVETPPVRLAMPNAVRPKVLNGTDHRAPMQQQAASTRLQTTSRISAAARLSATERGQLALGSAQPRIIHQLEGPKFVGNGWQNFRQVIPAGESSFYALTKEGSLLWYRHDGFGDGTEKWSGPVTVDSGWNSYTRIFGGENGILYAIGSDGSLQWFRHSNYADATPQLSAVRSGAAGRSIGRVRALDGPRPVGTGWGNFVHVFSTGEGVIYAVTADGRLMWYRHLGFQNGTPQWEGPKQVGSGWGNMKRIFSPGQGVIYAVTNTGQLLWYKHDDYLNGMPTWEGPSEVAADWSSFVLVFPKTTSAPQPQQIH